MTASQLKAVIGDRNAFDPLLSDLEARCGRAELAAIAEEFMGYSVGRMTKAQIVKAMHNWQRIHEQNQIDHESQARTPL